MPEEQEMSFLDHLEELRWHLMRAVASIAVFAIAAFLAKSFVFETLILGPSKTTFWTYRMMCKFSDYIGTDALCIDYLPFEVQNRTLTGQFTMHILASFVIGLVCAFPYAFWEMWRFVKPGLYETEQKVSRGATFFVSLLFTTGILFGYFIVSPLAINFLSNYQVDPSILNEIDLSSYVQTLVMIVLACGVMFQLPIVIFFLSKAGLVTPKFLKQYRKHAAVIILVVSAIITPPDPITQIFVSFPIFMLYEAGILISAWVIKKDGLDMLDEEEETDEEKYEDEVPKIKPPSDDIYPYGDFEEDED
ncbi:twin-arginine translocase subunit TatC [Flammeovirgaceae bacterium SG7u.111]|nr:twin-arginine translocase subunit TatC [Flammeovirgaceae bacterium SG7u.132]WPO35642.1 twin-arginine translocase subunit TatC [Flammeovirgaceae bacterium SG7u.111]